MGSASSNLVRLAYIKEVTYGETPVTGDFETARFTSESLSGSPNTVESKQIRTDRMSSGQVVTGLQVQGGLNFELAKETQLEDMFESLMQNTWDTQVLQTVDLSYDNVTKQLDRATGVFSLVVGDIILLAGFSNAKNNVPVMVTEIVDTNSVKISGPVGMVTEVGTGTTYKRYDKISIGSNKKSFSLEKKFLDLSNKAIIYKGMMVGSMDLNVAFGELITGAFNLLGNDTYTVDQAADHITNTRTVNAAANTQTMNGSIDMPVLISSAIGVLGNSGFAIKNISIKADNNLSAQNVIGRIAPRDYTNGTMKIDIDLGAYLDDASWAILPKKLTQDPFGLGFILKNNGGSYGFFLPSIQVSFDDPASAGQNQDVMLSMKGMAKVGNNGESALVIYKG